MPKDNGWYYDVYHFPWRRDDLTVKDIENYPWPDPADPARFVGMREKVKHAVEVEKRAVIVGACVRVLLKWLAGCLATKTTWQISSPLRNCWNASLKNYWITKWSTGSICWLK